MRKKRGTRYQDCAGLFEVNSGSPANPATLNVIRQAFAAAGVRFTDQGGVEPPEKSKAE